MIRNTWIEMGLEKVLQDREKTHGDFEKGAEIFDQLMELLEENRDKFTVSQRYGLTHIMGKLTRIIGGNANEIDHWRDLAGYATLVVKSLKKEQSAVILPECECKPIVVKSFRWGDE